MFHRQNVKSLNGIISASLILLLMGHGCTKQPTWEARFDGDAHDSDGAWSVAVDDQGHVYVAGWTCGIDGETDYLTIKYDANGNEVWIASYNGPGNGSDGAGSLAVDDAGNVYVTGGSEGIATDIDYATIKYDGNGNELWVARYNGPGNGTDSAEYLAIDGAGNVTVTGRSDAGDTEDYDYLTIQYDADGHALWVARYDGLAEKDDRVTALAVDDAGHVYVTGWTRTIDESSDYGTIKYDADGNLLWLALYDGPTHGSDLANALAVDSSGNVYVTGSSNTSGTDNDDYVTIKYDAGGIELWVKRYDGPAGSRDSAEAIAVDQAGNILVTGSATTRELPYPFPLFTITDYATIKYDADGNELWIALYDGAAFWYDDAHALAVDDDDNIYVTGRSSSLDTTEGELASDYDYATVKYDAAGKRLWTARYGAPGHGEDYAVSLVVDHWGDAYVTGWSEGIDTDFDAATLKYAGGKER